VQIGLVQLVYSWNAFPLHQSYIIQELESTALTDPWGWELVSEFFHVGTAHLRQPTRAVSDN